MRTRFAVAVLLIAGWGWAHPPKVRAAFIVVSNRSRQEVRFLIMPPQDKAKEYTIGAGDLVPVRVADRVEISFLSGKARRQYLLRANAAYYFAELPDGLALKGTGSASDPAQREPWPPPLAVQPSGQPALLLTIPVKILVDDAEPYVQRVWEKRLRERLKEASDIVERHCGARFEVAAVETWKSDDHMAKFQDRLSEFERKVTTYPARLAIGFSSRGRTLEAQMHVGVTRFPLHTHILIQEGYPPAQRERLAVLVHELGHYLGAAHSPEPDSVMRPKVGDGKAVWSSFRIAFDPLNTLAMSLVAEEVGTQRIKSLRELSRSTKAYLRNVYSEMARAFPDDPVAAKLAGMVADPP